MNDLNENYQWILKTIKSSVTVYQFDSCENLINNFINLYPEYKKIGDALIETLSARRRKYFEVEIFNE